MRTVYRPTTVLAVPLTATPRTFPSHIAIEPDVGNGLESSSCALVEQIRAVAIERCGPPFGNAGPVIGHQLVDIVAMIIGIP